MATSGEVNALTQAAAEARSEEGWGLKEEGLTEKSEEDQDADFTSSKLGTKQHWDDVYDLELKNFKENGDVGEVWFGYDSVERIVEWMEETPLVAEDNKILDLGCGNGVLMIELHKAGFHRLTGVDYSQAAVDLAKMVAKDEGKDREMNFLRADILDEIPDESLLITAYDVCVDKGTYDAISLNPQHPEQQREKYTRNVSRLLASSGLLIITSCNWTQDELVQHFGKYFTLVEKIKTPTFNFGGQTGSRETSLIFIKQDIHLPSP